MQIRRVSSLKCSINFRMKTKMVSADGRSEGRVPRLAALPGGLRPGSLLVQLTVTFWPLFYPPSSLRALPQAFPQPGGWTPLQPWFGSVMTVLIT